MSFVEENAGAAKDESQHAKKEPVGAGRIRLDALTIAGLTGTPAGNSTKSSFFGPGHRGAAESPSAGSDATLGSIQDSACSDDQVCWFLRPAEASRAAPPLALAGMFVGRQATNDHLLPHFHV